MNKENSMRLKIGKSSAIPAEFHGLGNIILKSEIIRKLEVIPGDFVLITKRYEGQEIGIENVKRVFKISVPFDSGLDFGDCLGLIEESAVIGFFNELGEFNIEKINKPENLMLREIYIESPDGEDIENTTLLKIKKYLLQKKIPVNPQNIFIFDGKSFFFSPINESGIINSYSNIYCFCSWIKSKIEATKRLIDQKKSEKEEELRRIELIKKSIDNALNKIEESEEVNEKKEEVSKIEQDIELKQSELKQLEKEIKELIKNKLKLENERPSRIIEEIKNN